MREKHACLVTLGLVGAMLLSAVAQGGGSGIWRTDRSSRKDNRVRVDRLHSRNNPNQEDDAFLNAVGAIWSYAIEKSASGYEASTGHDAATGFLIDRCHVLTNLHTAYTEDTVVDPPVGKAVTFAVGQTDGDRDRGALQGLRFLYQGTVIAHGGAIIVDHRVHDPDNDWAVIRLTAVVDGTITPMAIAAIDPTQLPVHFTLSAAGFPTDHREQRGEGFKLKELWKSEGQVVDVVAGGTGAIIQTTIQTTPGNSGGPVYGEFGNQNHIVVGMVQGIRGNGIDASEAAPNAQLMLTPGTLAKITEAEAQTPCP